MRAGDRLNDGHYYSAYNNVKTNNPVYECFLEFLWRTHNEFVVSLADPERERELSDVSLAGPERERELCDFKLYAPYQESTLVPVRV